MELKLTTERALAYEDRTGKDLIEFIKQVGETDTISIRDTVELFIAMGENYTVKTFDEWEIPYAKKIGSSNVGNKGIYVRKKLGSRLGKMLEEAYAYGLKPREATELTLAEMASFISAKRKKEMEQNKLLAQIGYSGGMIASLSLAKKRPEFSEVFNFPKTEEINKNDIEKSKAGMLVWAEEMNRLVRKPKK